jgi:DNA-binding protein
MGKNKEIIANAPLGRILKELGAKRVSDSALEVFAKVIKEKADEIAEQAVKMAQHAGRKTVKESDIKLAAKKY